MTVEEYVVEVAVLAARGLGGTTTTSLPASSATSAPNGPTTSPASGGGGNGPTSSPLLFFVALGFGVVFTNLWIIVGVKYCFRYNQRNRHPRQDENGEPIDMTAMPRAHRRRREKKLMTMDEVNERFPLTKYKAWMSTRAEEGLSTSGGVAGSVVRAASVKNAEGVIAPYHDPESKEDPESTNATSSAEPEVAHVTETNRAPTIREADDAETDPHLHETKTIASTIPDNHGTSEAQEEQDEDDQIQIAVPTEMLANPGDSCAICIDTLEDDDDVRGLTCGHAFHASCLDPWLTSRRACCPLCKADYYVPKPRPEGEAATEAERAAGRRPPGMSGARIDMPAPPQYAFMGGRGGTPFRPRMVLPGRFMQISYAESRDGYGFPTVHRIPRLSRRQRTENPEVSYDAPVNPPTAPSRTWRSRVNQTFSFPLPGFHRRNNESTNTDQSPEIVSSANNPTPSQLEAGATH